MGEWAKGRGRDEEGMLWETSLGVRNWKLDR